MKCFDPSVAYGDSSLFRKRKQEPLTAHGAGWDGGCGSPRRFAPRDDTGDEDTVGERLAAPVFRADAARRLASI